MEMVLLNVENALAIQADMESSASVKLMMLAAQTPSNSVFSGLLCVSEF